MKTNWFTRTTGSPIRLTFTDCECHNYGREHCFGCVAEKDYEETPPRYDNETRKPGFKRVILTPTDLRFLAGLPERTFQPRRKQWQPRREATGRPWKRSNS